MRSRTTSSTPRRGRGGRDQCDERTLRCADETADERYSLFPRAHLAADLRLQQRALDRAEARAALDAGQGDDLVAGEQGADGKVGQLETVVAPERAQERRKLRRHALAGVI